VLSIRQAAVKKSGMFFARQEPASPFYSVCRAIVGGHHHLKDWFAVVVHHRAPLRLFASF
jgi:uncharacterized membrane-anchored protein YjiN (DUF445 family)